MDKILAWLNPYLLWIKIGLGVAVILGVAAGVWYVKGLQGDLATTQLNLTASKAETKTANDKIAGLVAFQTSYDADKKKNDNDLDAATQNIKGNQDEAKCGIPISVRNYSNYIDGL